MEKRVSIARRFIVAQHARALRRNESPSFSQAIQLVVIAQRQLVVVEHSVEKRIIHQS
jgi:hypothetical protein